MSDARVRALSSRAKLARVVLENRGPLSPGELAEEGRISESDAREALEELVAHDLAECVCALCHSKEELYEYTGEDGEDDESDDRST